MPDSPDHGDDLSLIQRLRVDDTKALETIFDVYFVPLVRFATGIVQSQAIAEEIVLDTLSAFWDRRASLYLDTTIRAYLYQSVRNRAQNEVRSQRREVARLERRIGEDHMPAIALPALPIDAQLEQNERLVAVRNAIAALSEPRRTIVLLRWTRQMGFAEIAHVTGLTEVAARAHVSRALATLRALLRDAFE